jgi:hypothetical protein
MRIYMFIAADYFIPTVSNSKIQRYKLEEGVKLDLDEHGKWCFYTNEFDENSPELLIQCTEEDRADIINVDSQEDLQEVQISNNVEFNDIEFYTAKKFIRTLSWMYSELRAEELIAYLKENIKPKSEIELWSIWLDEKKEPFKLFKKINELTCEDFKRVFFNKLIDEPKCLIVSRD